MTEADRTNVVLITGAPRRLGRTLALDFARRGWHTALHAHRRDADGTSLAAEIAAIGRRAEIFEAELTDANAVAQLVPQVAAAMGPPRCLINNASIFAYDDIASLTPETWNLHFAVNLTAPVFLSQSFARTLPATTTGSIVNIIDQRVWKPTPHFLSYGGSKSALWAMTQTLAQALAPRIRVNAVGPGPMLPSIHQRVADFDAQCAATLLARGTTPDEVAAAIRFILDAPAMTGQMIALDGGQHLAWATPDIGDGRG